MADTATTTRIGPEDHGRHMSLGEFVDADAVPGFNYELARGVIQVVQIPGGPHAQVAALIHRQLDRYWEAHPEVIQLVASGADCRVEAPTMTSERHPDRAVYLTPMPRGESPWAIWTPEIVIEIVSPSSEERDYHEKRTDYLAVGVQEYWIVDPQKTSMLALTRRGDTWSDQELGADGVYKSRLLPGFELKLAEVFRGLENS